MILCLCTERGFVSVEIIIICIVQLARIVVLAGLQ